MQTIEFNTINLFPTTIGSCYNTSLAEKVLPFAKEVLSNPQNLTNTWGYKNTYGNSNLPKTLIYKELKSFIIDVSKSFCSSLGITTTPEDVDLFFSEMNHGDYHPFHAHPNSFYSGVFYLDVPENSSCIRFHDPRLFNHFIHYDTNHPASRTVFDIKTQTGLFLIWQSWVPHEVLKNLTDGRTTVVFNLSLSPAYKI